MALDIIRPGHRVEKPSLVQCLWSMWLWTKALPELDLFRPLLGGIAPPNALSSLLGGIRCCPCYQEVTKIWGGKCVTYGWHRQMCGCGGGGWCHLEITRVGPNTETEQKLGECLGVVWFLNLCSWTLNWSKTSTQVWICTHRYYWSCLSAS